MSIATNKTKVDVNDRDMTNIPELPSLPSLNDADRASLSMWWRDFRDLMLRFEDKMNAKISK